LIIFYLPEQIGFLGCWGEEVDAIDHYIEKIEGLTRKVNASVQSYI